MPHSRIAQDQILPLLVHEMRTPLCAIVGLADWLLEERLDAATARAALCDIQRAGERLTRLLEDCAALWRARSAPVLERRPAALPMLLEQAIAETPAAEGVRVELRLEPELPVLTLDADRIVQVLVNLLANALRYSPPGGVVEIEARRSGGGVRICVRDRGPGLDAAVQARLFEPFARGRDTEARRHAGFGLGLYFCRLAVEAHGGRIEASSRAGRGTAMTLVLPART